MNPEKDWQEIMSWITVGIVIAGLFTFVVRGC